MVIFLGQCLIQTEKYNFSVFKPLISISYMIRHGFEGYACESNIASFHGGSLEISDNFFFNQYSLDTLFPVQLPWVKSFNSIIR